MALQYRMPFLPNHADMVSEHLAVARQDGPVTFFDASGPIFICDAHDEGSLRFAAVMLTNPVLGLATPSQMATVLGRHRSRVHEYRKRYQDGGAKALDVRRRGPRGPTKFKGSVLTRAQTCLNVGTSYRKVAKFRAPDMPFGPRRNDGVRLSLLSGAKDPKRGLQELKRRRKHLTFTPKYAEYITGRIMASQVIHGTSIPHALPSQSRGHGQRAPCRGSAGRTGHLL